MSGGDGFTFYFGAASGSSRKALRQLEEPNVMLNYATKNNRPWDGIDRLFIDSGGYSFMKGMGEYETTDETYLAFVREHSPELFAYRDYPCEPEILTEHGRTVEDHQQRTLARHIRLADLVDDNPPESEPVAVLQGWTIDDYLRCIDCFQAHGVLTDYVGIGSVCRRNREAEIRRIILAVADALPNGTDLHAFGVKSSVLKYQDVRSAVASADSQSYSMQAQWATLHEKGAGNLTFRDVALQYLKQKQRIEAILMQDENQQTTQTMLGELT